MSRFLPPLLAGALLSLTACAQTSQPALQPAATPSAEENINRAVGKAMTDENLGLFFGLLRRSIAAAAEGKPTPELSAEEKAKLEASSKELQREALEASMKMLDQVEKEMRETIRSEGIGK